MLNDAKLIKLDLPPGMYRRGTQYQIQGRWYDGDLVRWVGDQLRPIGGWQKLTASALDGKARDMLSWSDSTGGRWMAIGTSTKLYVTHADGPVYDITPVGFTPGADDSIEGTGYGGGNYGAGTYGTPREGGTYFPLALWSLDTWGENLVGCARADGKIYQWELNTGTPAAVLTNAPTDAVAICVTDQRHLMALTPRGVEWSDKEDNEIWTPAADNEAGSFPLQSQTLGKAMVRVRGVNLAVTRTDAHSIQYVGAPFIYGRERIATDCGTRAPCSLVSTGDRAYWLGDGCFYESDGILVSPLECDVFNDVFNGALNEIQIEKVAGGYNPRFGEVVWFVPSSGSNEPDRYIIYNTRDGWWTTGTSMVRTSWDSGSVFGYPFAMGTDNHLYRHEDDWTDDGAARFSSIFAESGAMEVGAGARIGNIDQIIPDEEQQGEVTVTFKTRYTPSGEQFTFGPYSVRSDGYTDVRFSGRQATMRVQPVADGDFSIGPFRLNVTPGGRR